MANGLQLDPTRTTTLRGQHVAEMTRRFKIIRRAVNHIINTLDVLGLKDTVPVTFNVSFPEKQAWRFRTDAEKVTGFNSWFSEQVDAEILTVDAMGDPWTAKRVGSAYKTGSLRAYTDTHAEALADTPQFYAGSRKQFLISSFNHPERVSKLKFLYTRSFTELKGISEAMGQQVGRHLADGIASGLHPSVIARNMSKSIDKITRTRANVMARTEIVHAHAEGQLDSFDELGVKELQVMAEWSTAGDDRVCDRCAPLEGTVMTVDEARGLIPRHPNAIFDGSTFIPYGHPLEFVRAWYDGPSVILLAGDHRTTIGPNHPMITRRGVVAAGQINEGDEILYDLRHDDLSLDVFETNHKKVPLTEYVFPTLVCAGTHAIISTAGPDFHGDVVFCQGKIQTVFPARGLLMEFDSVGIEKFAERDFVFSDSDASLVPSDGTGHFGSKRIDLPASSPVGGSDSGIGREFVFLTVTHVEHSSFRGWAYDASIEHSSLYCNNGFVVHNCRCAWIPANVGEKDKGKFWSKQQKQSRVSKSLRAELPKKTRAGEPIPQTTKVARARSVWAGKDVKFINPPPFTPLSRIPLPIAPISPVGALKAPPSSAKAKVPKPKGATPSEQPVVPTLKSDVPKYREFKYGDFGATDKKTEQFIDKSGSFSTKPADPTQKKAFRLYQGSEYREVNDHLRFGSPLPDYLTDMKKNIITSMDEAFKSAPGVSENIKAWRGIDNFEAVFGDVKAGDLVGKKFIDQGYMSTSLNKRFSTGSFSNPRFGASMEIRVPKGSKTVWVDHISTKNAGEAEMLMPRGSEFRILEVSSDRRKVVVELIKKNVGG